MVHKIITTDKTMVDPDAVQAIIARMEGAKRRANTFKAKDCENLSDMEESYYLGMKLALEKLGLIEKIEVEF